MHWTRLVSLFAAALAGGVLAAIAAPATAQDRTLVIELVSLCGDQPVTAAGYRPTYTANVSDETPFSQPLTVASRDTTLSFDLNPPAGAESSYVIRRVYYTDPSTGRRGELAKPNRDSVATLLDLNPSDAPAGAPVTITVTVDQCAAAAMTRLKIATTASCTGSPGEDVAVQGGVAVRVGEQSVFSDKQGVIDITVPTGTYEIAANWFDAPLVYATLDGRLIPKDETGLPRVTLDRADATVEIRIATCGHDGREVVRATVTSIIGDGYVRVRRSSAHGGAFPGMKLRDGDLVTVTGDVIITWEDGHVITFAGTGQSVFQIGRGEDVPEGRTKQKEVSTFELLRGSVDFLFPPRLDEPKKKPFDAETGTVALGVKGTRFTLSYDDAAETTFIAVHEGLVAVTPVNPQLPRFDLAAGQSVVVSRTEVGPVTALEGAPPA